MKHWKKMLVLLLVICTLMTSVLASTAMGAQGKWTKGMYGNWYYVNEDGSYYTGWLKDGDNWYYLAPDIVRDWCMYIYEKPAGMYMFGTYYAIVTTPGWYKLNNGWYYINNDVTVAQGWKTINGKLYYFQPYMAANETLLIDGQYYSFNKNGVCTSVG